jgi:ribonuclease VapC
LSALVLDASALLALILDENGADEVAKLIDGAAISAANISEVGARLIRLGWDSHIVFDDLRNWPLTVHPFDFEQAKRAAALVPATRSKGLSFADRACLALADTLSATAVTGDRAWAELDIPIRIELIR